jgi:hypothetical protein
MGGAELTMRGRAPRAALVSATWYQGKGGPDSMAAGRGLSAAELEGASAVALVTDTLGRTLSGDGSAARVLGDTLVVNGHPFVIVGVLPRRPLGERPAVVVPFGAAASAIAPGPGARTPTLVVTSAAVEGTPALKEALDRRLEARYGPKQDRMEVRLNASRLAQVRRGMLVFKLVMGAITGISLLVGGVGIMNVLLSAVVERTREIGIRKAVGASRHDILTQFLSESVAIAGAGTLLGLIIGLAGAFGANAIIRATESGGRLVRPPAPRSPPSALTVGWFSMLSASAPPPSPIDDTARIGRKGAKTQRRRCWSTLRLCARLSPYSSRMASSTPRRNAPRVLSCRAGWPSLVLYVATMGRWCCSSRFPHAGGCRPGCQVHTAGIVILTTLIIVLPGSG